MVREGKWYKGQNSKGKCRMEQMPEEVEKKMVDGHWKVHKAGAPPDPGRPWMSNGFSGITFALHMCARVDIYGGAAQTRLKSNLQIRPVGLKRRARFQTKSKKILIKEIILNV